MPCAGETDEKAAQNAAGSISGQEGRPGSAWILTRRDRRRPALRGILHGEENWKSGGRVAEGIRAPALGPRRSVVGCRSSVVGRRSSVVGEKLVQSKAKRIRSTSNRRKPTTESRQQFFCSNSFLSGRIRSANTPKYRDRAGHNTGFSGVGTPPEVFPQDVSTGGAGPRGLPVGRPGQAIS